MRQVRPLPIEMYQPGLIAGEGVNKSMNRLSLPINHLWEANNVEPTSQGYSNKNIGVQKLNSNALASDKIQAMFSFNGNLCFISNGSFYTMPLAGGTVTLISASVFDTTNKIRFAYGTGSGVEKVYLCDGVTQPYTWDGTTLALIPAFAGDILTEIKASHRPNKVISARNRIHWSFDSTGVNEFYWLASDLEDGDTYTAGAGADNAFFEVLETGNQEITAIASLKRSGENLQSETLVAYTETQCFAGEQSNSPADNKFGIFVSQSRDIGAINQECVVSFFNDLYSMSRRGIGSLSSVGNDISSSLLEIAARVNPFIVQGQNNAAFDQSFAIHCKDRDLIWFCLPSGGDVTTSYEGFSYPETPMNLCIGYKYGIRDQAGEGRQVWYTKQQAGWAFSCAHVDQDDIFLGSYFGDIYKAFQGDEFERNPSTPNTHASITSCLETGDMVLQTGVTNYKELIDMVFHWFVDAGVKATITIYWNGEESGKIYTKQSGSGTGVALWGVALWGIDQWSGQSNADLLLDPADGGRSVRFKIEWQSELDDDLDGTYTSNHGSLFGVSGSIVDGGRMLKFR